MKEQHSVLSPKFGGGPHGLGDPEDQSLRKVEIDVMIPQKMRDIAKNEKCTEEVAAFKECCKSSGLTMVVYCRKQNENLKNCLTKWYNDEAFKERCKTEYLAERSEFRRTGVSKKKLKSLRELKNEVSIENN